MSDHLGPVSMVAPAKLTWSLRITGRRADGYHLLDAEMVTLDFGDALSIEPGLDGLVIDGPFAEGIPNDATNLVHKALAFTGRRARITVTKNIPHGGGLGGGSADAAAVLRWAGCTSAEDIRRSATIGADVPFCVVGGRARVTGIGENVSSLPYVDRQVTLVIPPLRVGTPEVYRAWDERSGSPSPRNSENPNDLEEAALTVEPALARWRDRIRESCGQQPVLAGSGATWFVSGHHDDLARDLPDARVILARTVAG